MGFDGIYKVYRRNKENNSYEKLAFYDKDGNELYNPFPSKDGMLNQMLLDYNRHGYSFNAIAPRRGVPDWYIEQLRVEYPDWFDNNNGWNYNPSEGTYYDYLELLAWSTSPKCEHIEYDAYDDENDDSCGISPHRNPLKDFVAQIQVYLDAYNIWYPKPGDIYIVCEMSY